MNDAGPLVCCVDDSEDARLAVDVAKRLAGPLGLELVLVHVEPSTEVPGVSAAPGGQERLHREELRDAEELMSRVAAEAGVGPAVARRAEVGDPASRILEVCEELGAALVVIGSRGRGGVASALLGSVSAAVAARAPCPCVVVPPTAAARPGA